MLSRPADARVRARFRVGAKRGVFRGENGGGAGVFCTMAFGGKGGKAGGKTRKIRPSSGDLCSFRYVAGRSVQDCGKVVQKLAGREDENYKLCTTLCAPLRLGTRIVQVSFPRCVRCVGVVVRRCAIRSFSLPPAEAGCPFRRRGRGGRQALAGRCARGRPPLPSPFPTLRSALRPSAGIVHGRRQADAGRTHGQGRGLPGALLTLRSALRPSAGGGAAVDKLPRGERTGRGGVGLVHFRLCAQRFGRRRHCSALREGASRLCLRLPPPCARHFAHQQAGARP